MFERQQHAGVVVGNGQLDRLAGVQLHVQGFTVFIQAQGHAAAQAARKAKAVPFGGRIDPHKYVSDTVLPAYLPRRGSTLHVDAPTVEVVPLSVVEAAKRLRPKLGQLWSPQSYGWLLERFPEGVPEDELEAVEAELRRPVEVRCRPLSSVGGV